MPRRLLIALALPVLVLGGCTSGDAGSAGTTSAASAPGPDGTTGAPTPEETYAAMSDTELATEAYVAGYPMVVSIRTMQRLGGLLGTNTLFWQTALAGPESRVIVAPNRDTLYSIAVLDLRSEPLVLTLPEVTDRYHTYQLLSPWTDSFAYIGTRATGGRAGSWVIAPPGWEGEAPEGAEVIESPTAQVFLLGRFLVDDDADVAGVLAVRDRSSLRPLSAVTGGPAGGALPPLGEPVGTAQDIPTDATFFDELVPSLAANPPPTEAQAALWAAVEERLGDDRAVLDAGATAGDERITAEVRDRTKLVDGWTTARDIGVYGDDLALRAFVSRIGWGANVPEEAVYPVARVDVDGVPLDGSRDHTITFGPGDLPPLEELGFWSLSAYGPDMFFAPHPSGRYTVGDRTPGLTPAADGSLTITLAHDEPAGVGGPGTAWLPVPDGPFVLMLRLYLPSARSSTGPGHPPVSRPRPVVRLDSTFRVLLLRTMLTSPFIFDGPLPPEEVVGRDEELAALRDRAAHGRFVLLHAPRRYGKTSLVHRLAHDAQRDQDLAVVIVDLEGVLTLDDIARRIQHAYRRLPRSAFGRALTAGLSALGTAGLSVTGAGLTLAPRAPAEATPVLEHLLQLPYEAAGRTDQRVLVVLDEFQAIAPVPNADAVLRSQIQHQRDRVSYLFAGSEQSLLRAIFADRARPLYGQAEQIALGPLPDDVAAALVHGGFAATDRDGGEAVAPLVATAGGHPQRLAFLADSLWHATPEGAVADLTTWHDALGLAIRRVNAELVAVEGGLPMTQRKVALLLALGEPPTGAAAARMSLSKGAARGALDALVDKGHAHERDGRVVLVDPLYGAWLRDRFGPGD